MRRLALAAKPPRSPSSAELPPEVERALPLGIPSPAEAFGSRHFGQCKAGTDNIGYPSLLFELEPARREPFGAFTQRIRGRELAIALGDFVLIAPTVEDRLPSTGLVRGFVSESERDDWLAKLCATPFRLAAAGR